MNWFKEYSVVISVPLAVASFFIGWYFNKKKMDIDKANRHFKDIKGKVIEPALEILNKIESSKPKSLQFPSWKEGSNSIFATNSQVEKFDPLPEKVLFYDFLDNHYPELKKIWDKAENELNSWDINYKRLRDLISCNLDKELKENSLYSFYVKDLRPRTEKKSSLQMNSLTVSMENTLTLKISLRNQSISSFGCIQNNMSI